ncbi:hypothetical protein AAT19DRAFT_10020 [Rhodotorula toruloides]|uniref:Uncharacterized protein n=1 Tax=Rhodotorula toruloides TaxID=5286 RepID=A0A2T0A1N8_RHOTO|nr:hypothetical protein AAT19DRAFT_10020 [Rhodotorula toruloides]
MQPHKSINPPSKPGAARQPTGLSPAPHLALPAPSTSPSLLPLASHHTRTSTTNHVDLAPADGAAGATQGCWTPPLPWPLGREGGAEDRLHAHAPGGGARRRAESASRLVPLVRRRSLTSLSDAGRSLTHSSRTTKCTTSSASRTTSSSVRATC